MNIVLSTCRQAEARLVAHRLVEERYAACCNLVPHVESIYWWEGKVTTDCEVLLIFKTPKESVPELMRRLLELHPYETPEILAFDVSSGLEAYLAWVARETVRARGGVE